MIKTAVFRIQEVGIPRPPMVHLTKLCECNDVWWLSTSLMEHLEHVCEGNVCRAEAS